MEKIKLGIVGLFRGSAFVAGYKAMEDVEIKAVCECDPSVLESVKKDLPEGTLTFTDYNEFIDCGLDAVALVNNFHEHAKFAIIALERGIHVLSETTAAPTLGECVALCEAVEKSGCKYMLAANVPHMFGCVEMARLYREGTFGRVLYAEGEYFHPSAPGIAATISGGEYHWRRYLPRTYYNMHDLGTLMSITGTLPKNVNAKAIFAPDLIRKSNKVKHSGDIGAIILTEMNNGAVFRTTACASLPPEGKWFRLACENGTLETHRDDQDSIYYKYNSWATPADTEATRSYAAPRYDMSETQKRAGHGGTDYDAYRLFIDYLHGKATPFFDVYHSVALSAVGILAWRSVLNNGAGYDIPDFTDKEARRAVADDFLSPFPDEAGNGITLPCSSQPYERPTEGE